MKKVAPDAWADAATAANSLSSLSSSPQISGWRTVITDSRGRHLEYQTL
jgi:hypothetical protein